MKRRSFLTATLATGALARAPRPAPAHRLDTFECDLTPFPGDPLIWVTPMHTAADSLRAKGIATKAGGGRYAFSAVDWCGLSNSPLLLFRRASADAIGARLQYVLVHTVRQPGPYLDADAYDTASRVARLPALPVERLATFAESLSVAAKSAMKCLMPFDRVGTSTTMTLPGTCVASTDLNMRDLAETESETCAGAPRARHRTATPR